MNNVLALKKNAGEDNAMITLGYRDDFPILQQTIYGQKQHYLDSAASAQKPKAVLDALQQVYTKEYSNIHRGVHYLSQRSTLLFEQARADIAAFIGAASADEIIFTRNATEGLNLVAQSWGQKFLKDGDVVLISSLEHHANIVPWHLLQQKINFSLKIIPMDDAGNLDIEAAKKIFEQHPVKLLGLSHLSNALGVCPPVKELIALAKNYGALVLLDSCQAVVHLPVNVQELGADFMVFSGHKLYGPSGIGVLWGRAAILADMPPYQGGGEMIASVSFTHSTYKDPPHRFEAGTPAIAEAIALGAAVSYLRAIGMEKIAAHDSALLRYAEDLLLPIKGFNLLGQGAPRACMVSFTLDGVHPHDLATFLDCRGIAVRAGNHCAQPLMQRLGVAASARASFGLYTDSSDIDALHAGLLEANKFFA
ncbi:MAG: SufS family cysteine desulfurase [Alphaproteobacteria bacterium]